MSNLYAMLKHPEGASIAKREMIQPISTKGQNTIQLYPDPVSVCCASCLERTSCKFVRTKTRVMNTLLGNGKPEEALSVFMQLIEDLHIPSLITYTILLYTLTILKRYEFIHPIISEVEKNGMKPDSKFFIAVITAFSRSGNMEEAMNAFQRMKEYGYRPCTDTYNTLIKGFSVADRPDESMKLLDQMSMDGIAKPNIRSYNLLIRSWCMKGNIPQAWNVVHRMTVSGLKPNAVTYTTLALAYARNGDTKLVEEMILEMQNNNLQPDEKTFCMIAGEYCKVGKLRDAINFVYKLKGLRMRPSLGVFNSLIKGFLDITDTEGVDEVFKLMEEFGVKPNVIIYSTAMNAYIAAGLMNKCQEMFDHMVKLGIKPDGAAYCILAKSYVRAREPEKAEELLNHMINMGLRPNVVMFTTVINGWCSTGKMECANKIFETMCECGVSPNCKTFETLIWGYGEAKQPWKAEEMLQMMEEFGVQPEKSTFKLIADAWQAAGVAKDADRVLINNSKDFPVASSENVYQKPLSSSSYSDMLLTPNKAIGESKGSGSSTIKSRLIVRDSSISPWYTASKSINTARTCQFGGRPPIICQKQFHGQSGLYSHRALSCTLVFLN